MWNLAQGKNAWSGSASFPDESVQDEWSQVVGVYLARSGGVEDAAKEGAAKSAAVLLYEGSAMMNGVPLSQPYRPLQCSDLGITSRTAGSFVCTNIG